MAKRNKALSGFLTRLLHNEAGNTLAIVAASVIPLIGLIGGGVDLSRAYLAKSRLQQACDAGSLAGRREMGSGSWTSATQTVANNFFDANFTDGSYGTTGRTRSFTESNDVVTGTASVTVPTSVMKIFGNTGMSISVTCTSEMRIPNTDVMFVLDTTGSMDDCPDGSNCYGNSSSKIAGLRTAVKCFYEALAKLDIDNASCGAINGSNSSSVQIRFGFVPYATNVNVGSLLQNDWMANSWNYQSREPSSLTTVYAWTAGTESSTSWGSWSSPPSNLTTASSYSGWSNISGGGSVTINGTSWPKTYSGKNSTTCPLLNTKGTILDYTDSGSVQSATQTPGTPNHPDTQQTLTYSQDDDHTVRGYRYNWSSSGSGSCRLQQSNNRTYTLDRTGTSTKPVTWTQYQRVDGWTYKQRSLDVSGLKAGGSSWNSSVALPIGYSTVSATLSGSTSSSNIYVQADTSVSWNGCIEERQTWQNTDGDPSNDYSPIPSTAHDLDIDLVPSTGDTTTQWGPSLPYAVWGRESGGSYSYANVTTSVTSSMDRNWSANCPSAASKLATYPTASVFRNYVDGLVTGGNTYHDIGLIWGARLLSSTGLFASENATTPSGGAIQRHLIFMTDGDTNTGTTNLAAYGLSWWDRRQTSSSSAPTSTLLNSTVDARTQALCTAIKNKNITLWVIAYGTDINSASKANLQTCASTGRYYAASTTTDLVSQFQSIASEISQLRLTQ